MGIAAIPFVTLGRYLNLRTAFDSGVGIREGVLRKSIATLSHGRSRIAQCGRAASYWWVRAALHGGWSMTSVMPSHGRELSHPALMNCSPSCITCRGIAVLLAVSGAAPDVGHMISNRGQHKHGEILRLTRDIQGLEGPRSRRVAQVVRYIPQVRSLPGIMRRMHRWWNNDKRMVRRWPRFCTHCGSADNSHDKRVTNLRSDFSEGAVGGSDQTPRADARRIFAMPIAAAELSRRNFMCACIFDRRRQAACMRRAIKRSIIFF